MEERMKATKLSGNKKLNSIVDEIRRKRLEALRKKSQ